MDTLPLVILLIGLMLITMLTRVFLPIGQKLEGPEIRRVTLSFRYRLLYHRTSIYLIGLVMVLGGLGGWMSFALQVVMIMGAFAISDIPIRYKFTANGVALNNVVVREWAEFETAEIKGRFYCLLAKGNSRDFKLLIPPFELERTEKLSQKLLKVGHSPDVVEEKASKAAPAKIAGFRPAKKVRRAS